MHSIEYTLRKSKPSRKRPRFASPMSPALPRLTRLMALAIKMDGLLHGPDALSKSDLARLGRVSRSRITQILNLLLLAPDLQEQLLFLAPAVTGRQAVCESKIRHLAGQHDWDVQRAWFKQLMASDTKKAGS